MCGLPVVFESSCEKKGGGPDGQRNWLKGGRRNWKERHLRLTQRWLQYLDSPLPNAVVKGSKEVSKDWVVTFNQKHSNAITIECRDNDVFNVRFSNAEVRAIVVFNSLIRLLFFDILLEFAALSQVDGGPY